MSNPWGPKQGGTEVSLPGYRDFVLIASSSGSRVYRARQEALDRPVAVKVLLLDDAEAAARFQREIEITVKLGRQHPYIVKVIDTALTPEGRPCIVMEYYDRGSLRDRLRTHGPLPVSEVVEAGAIVADALSFAHAQGVLHRDVKPQNILVLPTSYVVADFGIARPMDASQRTSSVDWFTFQHASPQILDGEQPSVADDIWSLGSTLFMLLDGEPPFASDNPAENTALAYMKRVRTGQLRPMRRVGVPDSLFESILRCMRPLPQDRFPDAASLRDAFRGVASEQRSWAPSPTSGPVMGSAAPPMTAGPAESTGPGPSTTGLTDSRPAPTGYAGAGTGPRPPGVTSNVEPTSATSWTQSRDMSPAALADLVAAAAAAGRTGVEETSYTAPPKLAKPARSGRVRVVVGSALAVVLAGALAVAGVALARSARDPQAGPPPSSPAPANTPSPAAQQRSQAPTPAASKSNVVDPAQQPRITAVQPLGNKTFNITWTDPSEGAAQFTVVRVTVRAGNENTGKGVRTVANGVTEAKVTLPSDDPGAPYCFLILATLDIDTTVPSSTQCVNTDV